MKDIIKKQLKIIDLLVKENIGGKFIHKFAMYNLMVAVIALFFITFSGQICLSKGKMPLLIPSTITRFERTGFYNDGRQWNFSAMLESNIKDEILFIRTDGSDRTILLYTAPGEYDDDKKIIISGQKNLVIELDKPIMKRVVFEVEVIMDVGNKLEIFDHTIDCFNKSTIIVQLSPKGRTIHHLIVVIKGEKATVGIKSIFFE